VAASSDPSSHSDQCFDDFAPNRLGLDGELHTSDNRKVYEHSLSYHSPSAVPQNTTLSRPNPMKATQRAHDPALDAVRSSANDSPINMPAYFNGWLPTSKPTAMTANAVDASRDLAPSSPAVAPAVFGRAIRNSTKLALPVPSNDVTRCVKGFNGDPLTFATAVYSPGPSLVREARAAQDSLSGDGSVMSVGKTDLTFKEDLESHDSDKIYGASYVASRRGAQRNKTPVAMAGLKRSESHYVSTAITQTLESFESTPSETSHTTITLTPGTRHGHGSDNGLPAKKLCSQCRRLILGCTSLCTKCRQVDDEQRSPLPEKNHSNERPEVVDSLKMTETVQHTTARDLGITKARYMSCKNTVTERSATKQPRSHDDVTSPPPTHDQNAVPDSPFVPESPDLVFEIPRKRLDTFLSENAKIEADQHRATKTLIPQKRNAIGLNATDYDHCFSKKKPRIFKPTTKSIAVNWPPMKSNQFPPAPKSDSLQFEYVSRDASVQTSVETVHRATSPRPISREMVANVDAYAKSSHWTDIQASQGLTGPGDISVVGGVLHKVVPSSPHSDQTSEPGDWRVEKRGLMLPTQQAKDLARRNRYVEQPNAAIARLERPGPRNGQAADRKAKLLAEDSGMLEYDGNIASRESSNLGADPIESARQWAVSDERALLNTLQNRGVMFEEDSSSESDVSMPPPRTKPVPKDPLWRCPQSSSDLFLIAPSLHANYLSFDIEGRRKEIAARPFRKRRRMNISYLRQERGENVHEEVKRNYPPRMIKVSSTTTSELEDVLDKNADGMASGQESELEMTFGDFVGVPANPTAILTEDKRLAFRDGTRDAKGALPRARERFIVTNRSVVCMEQ
jgi:hypothetical protein